MKTEYLLVLHLTAHDTDIEILEQKSKQRIACTQ